MEIDIKNDVLPKLNNVTKNSNGYQASCPAHDDRTPSLSIKDTTDKLVLFCHSGCNFEDIISELGLYEPTQKFKNNSLTTSKETKGIAETYDYTDENDNLLYQIVRFEPKGFALRRPNEIGGWVWDSKGINKTLYRLPDIIKAKQNNEMIVVCEGEKDVHSVKNNFNLTATTSPLGGNSWNDDYSDLLSDLDVVILPDNDDSGHAYAQTVVNSIYEKARSVKIIYLPNLAEKEDVTDWINKGGNYEELMKLIDNQEEWKVNSSALVKSENTLVETIIDGIYSDYFITAPLTDTGNAECFLCEYEDRFLFNKTEEQWYQWNDVVWQKDKRNVVDDSILKVIRSRQNAVLEISDFNDASEKLKGMNYLIRCEDINKRKNIKQAIELLPQFITTIEEYDNDLFLAATQNGTLDLKQASFRQSLQKDYLTLQY